MQDVIVWIAPNTVPSNENIFVERDGWSHSPYINRSLGLHSALIVCRTGFLKSPEEFDSVGAQSASVLLATTTSLPAFSQS